MQVVVTTLWSACSFGHKLGAFAAVKRVIDRREELRSLITALRQKCASPARLATNLSESDENPETPLDPDVHTPSPAAGTTEQIPAELLADEAYALL
jgi:hypothetical protein